jgi:hypothetical protein
MLSKDNKLYDQTVKTDESMVEGVFALCVLLRILIGILIIVGTVGKAFILSLCAMVVFIFSMKYKTVGDSTWKFYPKAILTYGSVALINIFSNDEQVKKSSGMLLISEAILGFNTRSIINKIT